MSAKPASMPRAPRDPRLDFFRGIGMFIIYIAHTPGNFLTLWIPARFGFSDATEIFVFCSGMASAIAFGTVFNKHGWAMGTARIIHRVWQVYWAHIAVFFVIALIVVLADGWLDIEKSYVAGLNLRHFFNNTATNLAGLMTLTYVPNYFDILPMYLVILGLVPIVMALARITPLAAGAFIVALWVMASMRLLDLPAEPWSARTWFFNPFSWQLVFFTGFAFAVGWLKPPPIDRRLVIAAVVIVLITIPFAYFRLYREFEMLKSVRADLREIGFLITKSRFGLFRYIHFLALAYLAYVVAGEGGRRLVGSAAWNRFVRIVMTVGQQSLAVFLSGLVLARLSGMLLDWIDGGKPADAIVTVFGCLILIAIAYGVGWFKSQPWRRKPKDTLSKTGHSDGFSAGRAAVPGE